MVKEADDEKPLTKLFKEYTEVLSVKRIIVLIISWAWLATTLGGAFPYVMLLGLTAVLYFYNQKMMLLAFLSMFYTIAAVVVMDVIACFRILELSQFFRPLSTSLLGIATLLQVFRFPKWFEFLPDTLRVFVSAVETNLLYLSASLSLTLITVSHGFSPIYSSTIVVLTLYCIFFGHHDDEEDSEFLDTTIHSKILGSLLFAVGFQIFASFSAFLHEMTYNKSFLKFILAIAFQISVSVIVSAFSTPRLSSLMRKQKPFLVILYRAASMFIALAYVIVSITDPSSDSLVFVLLGALGASFYICLVLVKGFGLLENGAHILPVSAIMSCIFSAIDHPIVAFIFTFLFYTLILNESRFAKRAGKESKLITIVGLYLMVFIMILSTSTAYTTTSDEDYNEILLWVIAFMVGATITVVINVRKEEYMPLIHAVLKVCGAFLFCALFILETRLMRIRHGVFHGYYPAYVFLTSLILWLFGIRMKKYYDQAVYQYTLGAALKLFALEDLGFVSASVLMIFYVLLILVIREEGGFEKVLSWRIAAIGAAWSLFVVSTLTQVPVTLTLCVGPLTLAWIITSCRGEFCTPQYTKIATGLYFVGIFLVLVSLMHFNIPYVFHFMPWYMILLLLVTFVVVITYAILVKTERIHLITRDLLLIGLLLSSFSSAYFMTFAMDGRNKIGVIFAAIAISINAMRFIFVDEVRKPIPVLISAYILCIFSLMLTNEPFSQLISVMVIVLFPLLFHETGNSRFNTVMRALSYVVSIAVLQIWDICYIGRGVYGIMWMGVLTFINKFKQRKEDKHMIENETILTDSQVIVLSSQVVVNLLTTLILESNRISNWLFCFFYIPIVLMYRKVYTRDDINLLFSKLVIVVCLFAFAFLGNRLSSNWILLSLFELAQILTSFPFFKHVIKVRTE
ncbi:hypothetical protein PCE1_002887 [Barthelona sp. PCE]